MNYQNSHEWGLSQAARVPRVEVAARHQLCKMPVVQDCARWSPRRCASSGKETTGRVRDAGSAVHTRTGAAGGGPDVGEAPDRGEGEAGVRERLHDGAGVPGRRQVVRPVGVPEAVARLVGVRRSVDLAMASGIAQTPLATHLCMENHE